MVYYHDREPVMTALGTFPTSNFIMRWFYWKLSGFGNFTLFQSENLTIAAVTWRLWTVSQRSLYGRTARATNAFACPPPHTCSISTGLNTHRHPEYGKMTGCGCDAADIYIEERGKRWRKIFVFSEKSKIQSSSKVLLQQTNGLL